MSDTNDKTTGVPRSLDGMVGCQWGVGSRAGACGKPTYGVVNARGVEDFPVCKDHAKYAEELGWDFTANAKISGAFLCVRWIYLLCGVADSLSNLFACAITVLGSSIFRGSVTLLNNSRLHVHV